MPWAYQGNADGVIADSRDWLGATSAEIVRNVTVGYTNSAGRFYPGMAQSTPDKPAVLGFHDTTPETNGALQGIVDWMNTNHFCTAPLRANTTGGVVPPPAPAEPTAGNLVVNPSLESMWAPGNVGGFPRDLPNCFMTAGYGTPGVKATFTATTDPSLAHSGNVAENVTVANWANGDSKLVIVQRGQGTSTSNSCTPAATPGRTYTTWVWYKGSWSGYGASTDQTKVGIVAYYRNSSNQWITWASSPLVPPSSSWNLASFTTPALPSGATAVSFGLAIAGNGSLTTDDYAMIAN